MKAVNSDTLELVESLRRDVPHSPILEVMAKIDRKGFVPESFSNLAYSDIPLPIACEQTISQPKIVAMMTHALELTSNHRVLEIGTGSGYQTLILSHLAKRVYSLERHRALAQSARELIIGRFRRENVTIVVADGSRGLPDAAPFDRILVTAACDDIPPMLLGQLKVGGIMVLPVARSDHDQRLVKVRRAATELDYNDICGVRFVPLVEGVPDD